MKHSSLKILAFFALGLTIVVDIAHSQANNARIDGIVQSDDNKPVRGAYVTATQARPGGARSTSQPSGADGSFTLQNLAPGSYTLCAQAPGAEVLDPCGWAPPIKVTLAAGQSLTGFKVTLVKGTTLRVQIDDPSRFLATNEGKTPGAHLLVGVWSNDGLFHAAPVASKNNNGRDYTLVVPLAAPLKVSVASQFFQIADDKGTAIAKGGSSIPIQAAAGSNLAPLRFTITGAGLK